MARDHSCAFTVSYVSYESFIDKIDVLIITMYSLKARDAMSGKRLKFTFY